MLRRAIMLLLVLAGLSACQTYYQRNQKFNEAFRTGDLAAAEQTLAKYKKGPEGKERLLYFLNRGVVAYMQGDYSASNGFLEQAYLVGEDAQRNYVNEAVSFLSNPNMIEYRGESYELLLLHFYKTMNFLNLGEPDKAMVEVRRMDIKLNQLADKYKSEKKYDKDAFVNTLMGLIYDSQKDYNNAFIAYRNAYNVYVGEYKDMFGVGAPQQLKEDLLRTAYLNGFISELETFEREFGMKYSHDKQEGGDLVFFWLNGLGPVKSEVSFNFFLIQGAGGAFVFQNEELGIALPVPMSQKQYEEQKLSDIQFIRATFPKMVDRPTYYAKATLSTETGKTAQLEQGMDVSKVAFKSLNDRMFAEMGKSLLRLASKKAGEMALRNENEYAGAALGIINAVTEKADTRNWQTLPHDIHYTRMHLPAGQQQVTFHAQPDKQGNVAEQTFTLIIPKEGTVFQSFSTTRTASSAAGMY